LEAKTFTHNNPSGFYKVVREPLTAVFPILNAGTSGMDWIAATECGWLQLESDVGLDVRKHGGVDFLIVTLHNAPETFEIAVITITSGDAGDDTLKQSKQVTVVINSPWEN
jgi:hypothetical protein